MTGHIAIEEIRGFKVVRDDYTFGGTKYHALIEWLPTLNSRHIIYAGSVFGCGAPAVAVACEKLDIQCSILMSTSTYRPAWLDKVEKMRTKLIITDPTPVEKLIERAEKMGGYVMPLGFNNPDFMACIVTRAREIEQPERAWVPVVSGTLLRALEQAWPYTEFHGVCAARKHGYEGSAILHMAPEKFSVPAAEPPPYNSCKFSDAKVWQFAKNLGHEGDLIWNTNP